MLPIQYESFHSHFSLKFFGLCLTIRSSSNARVTSSKSLTSTLLVDSKHPFAVHLLKPGSHHQSIWYPLFFQIIQRSIWISPHNLLDFEIVAVRCRREDWSRMPQCTILLGLHFIERNINPIIMFHLLWNIEEHPVYAEFAHFTMSCFTNALYFPKHV